MKEGCWLVLLNFKRLIFLLYVQHGGGPMVEHYLYLYVDLLIFIFDVATELIRAHDFFAFDIKKVRSKGTSLSVLL